MSSVKEAAERELIMGTITDIREALEQLTDHRGLIEEEIRAKKARLAAWEAKLAKLPSSDGRMRSRRVKGENFKTVFQLLEKTPMTIADLARRSQIPPSSVRAILTRSGA